MKKKKNNKEKRTKVETAKRDVKRKKNGRASGRERGENGVGDESLKKKNKRASGHDKQNKAESTYTRSI